VQHIQAKLDNGRGIGNRSVNVIRGEGDWRWLQQFLSPRQSILVLASSASHFESIHPTRRIVRSRGELSTTLNAEFFFALAHEQKIFARLVAKQKKILS